MGLILDSSVVIAAEGRGETPEQFLQQVIQVAGNQEAALSSIGLTELVHGIYRAATAQAQARRKSFVEELHAGLTTYPTQPRLHGLRAKSTENKPLGASSFHLLIC